MTDELIEFGDGSEPWSVARRGVKRWMHCIVREVGALTEARRDELGEWLTGLGLTAAPPSLLITRGDDGYRVHVAGGTADVELAALPVWLQRPEADPKPARATKARK